MEHFRSSGTSGGLLHSRTESAYVKAAVSEFLRCVALADAEAIASGQLSTEALRALTEAVAGVVSQSWLDAQADDEVVAGLWALTREQEPAAIDAVLSKVLRARFPTETVRPERNSGWG